MLNLQEINQRVVKVYQKVAPVDYALNGKPTPLDSLGFMAFIIELEEEFSISINTEEITKERFATALSVAIYLEEVLNKK